MLAIGLVVWASSACSQEMIQKKRVALLNFEDYSSASTEAAKIFGADAGTAGKGVSAQLIERLTAGGKYTLVDQSAVKRLLEEQSRSDDDGLDAYGRAAKIGRLIGLDAMIVGAITRFGPDASQMNSTGGRSGLSTWKSKAYVDITARVLDMTTAEVIAEFTAKGESARTGEVTRVKPRGNSTHVQDILGSEFVDSLLGEATRNAVEKVAGQLNSFAEKIPTLKIAFDGLVAEVNGNLITVNLGKRSGLKVGDRLTIFREGYAATDPGTGAALPPLAEQIGDATVSEVLELSATATFSGQKRALVGDRVTSALNLQAAPRH